METDKGLLRLIAVESVGNAGNYEYFKKTMQASPILYGHDFHFYNDDISTRHQRNMKEIFYLKKLLKQQKISAKMLYHNVFNTFYPSYVLHHHHSIFLPLLQNIQKVPAIQNLVKQGLYNQITGAYFQQIRSTNLKHCNNSVSIDDKGFIQMDINSYFYSLVTSPYITHAAFLAKVKGKSVLIVVNLRDNNGEFSKGVKVFDFGATISSDYLPIGYNFSNLKPLVIVELQPKQTSIIQNSQLQQRFQQFSYSLKDLQKSLWLTTKYTSMRKQFKNLQGSKEQRPIITYQVVAGRIIDGFSQFIAFTDLYARIIQSKKAYILFTPLLESAHHIILEHVILLRQICGGFGYMQYSGHPGCIERVCNRAGCEPMSEMEFTVDFLKATQFYSSTDQLKKYYSREITSSNIEYMHYFGIFLTISFNMRNKRSHMTVQQYRREYLKQTSIMAMHSRQENLRYERDNVHCKLLQYLLANYVLQNSQFISWQYIKIEKKVFFEQLQKQISTLLEQLVPNLGVLCSTLELTYLRNTIVGRQDQNDFYRELVETSKSNLRNSKQYTDYIRAPVAEMLTSNRAKI